MNNAKLQTNLDTDFLKLIAVIAMTLDHVGTAFFPSVSGISLGRTAGLSHLLLLHDCGPAVYP